MMLPPTGTPGYSTNSVRTPLAYPLMTSASGKQTQKLRVPNVDRRETLSGTSPLNTMYVSSEDRYP